MDTEQIKLILDTLSTMGAAGKEAFIWWLVLDKVLPVIGWLITFAGIVWVALRIIRSVGLYREFRDIRDTLGVGRPGPLSDSEIVETLKRIKELALKNQSAR